MVGLGRWVPAVIGLPLREMESFSDTMGLTKWTRLSTPNSVRYSSDPIARQSDARNWSNADQWACSAGLRCHLSVAVSANTSHGCDQRSPDAGPASNRSSSRIEATCSQLGHNGAADYSSRLKMSGSCSV